MMYCKNFLSPGHFLCSIVQWYSRKTKFWHSAMFMNHTFPVFLVHTKAVINQEGPNVCYDARFLLLIINIYFSLFLYRCTLVRSYDREKNKCPGLKTSGSDKLSLCKNEPSRKAKGFEQKPFVKRFNEHFVEISLKSKVSTFH